MGGGRAPVAPLVTALTVLTSRQQGASCTVLVQKVDGKTEQLLYKRKMFEKIRYCH